MKGGHGMKVVRYIGRNLMTVVGIVFVWRGVWYALDEFDKAFFAGNPWISIVGGVVVGILLLYLPDKDLKEIEKL